MIEIIKENDLENLLVDLNDLGIIIYFKENVTFIGLVEKKI